MIISALLSLSLVPVCLTRSSPPVLPQVSAFSLAALYQASPLGLLGVFLSGSITGALYGLAPVFAAYSGFGMTGTALFMTLLIAGGVLLQWPLGRLSDVFDRRFIIIAVCIALVAVSAAMFLLARGNDLLSFATTLAFGGLAFGIYPLCLAHTNDCVEKADLVAASGELILLNSAGAVLGPICASTIMNFTGPEGLFLFRRSRRRDAQARTSSKCFPGRRRHRSADRRIRRCARLCLRSKARSRPCSGIHDLRPDRPGAPSVASVDGGDILLRW